MIDPVLYEHFPYKLRAAVWELTLACCFCCAYCGSGAGRPRENELSTEECLDVVDQLAELGLRRISLIGGEVFMRGDWAQIAGALTRRGITTCIITNGYRMTPDILRTLKEIAIESVAVSIDGPERVHDAFRQKGSYRMAFDTIDALVRSGIPVSVISALRADNAPLLPEFYETLLRYPIFAWQIQACSPMGNAGKNGVNVRFDVRSVLSFIQAHQGTQPFYICAADNIGYYSPQEGSVRVFPDATFQGCCAGRVGIGIDSVGNVRGCESLYDPRFHEGNLRERSLWDIWTDPNAFAYNRRFTPDMLTGLCSGCAHGNVCRGGCRSYNWFTHGKLWESPCCARHDASPVF